MDWLEVIDKAGLPVQYRYSNRAKRLSLRVVPGGIVELIIPQPSPPAHVIANFLVEYQNWIHKHAKACQNNPLAWPESFTHGQTVPLIGERVPLTVCFSDKKTEKVSFVAGRGLVVDCALVQCSELSVRQAVIEWYQLAAKRQVEKALRRYVPQVGHQPSRLTIKASRQLWGSLNHLGEMTINWLLLLAPSAVLMYVVLHELCHFYDL